MNPHGTTSVYRGGGPGSSSAGQPPPDPYPFDDAAAQRSRDLPSDERRAPSSETSRLQAPASRHHPSGSSSSLHYGSDAERRAPASPHDLSIREKPVRPNGTLERKGTQRLCGKCQQPLSGQFVRAIGGTFHLECFKCEDCGQVVASKFFPVDAEDAQGQYPLCETDYFRRLDLLCHNCGGALRGSYVTAIDRKYHIDHFTCSVCPTAFGAKDSYYEHGGQVYCHYHYSTRFAQKCNGCQTAILKQFVEIYRNGENQHWHPECYMIHKFWNVRLSRADRQELEAAEQTGEASLERREAIRQEEEQMEEKTYRIWSVLSAFEESSAACISDMLLHVSNGAYMEGVLVARRFIHYVDVLFSATDRLDATVISHGLSGLSYGREAKLLCKRIVSFFTLLTRTQDTGVKRLGVTQELLSLVTGLAHYLKLLIRISLQSALRLERERHVSDGLRAFLDDLAHVDTSSSFPQLPSEDSSSIHDLADEQSDLCAECQRPIDDECLRAGIRRYHSQHLICAYCHHDLPSVGDPSRAVSFEPQQQVYCGHCVGSAGFLAADGQPVEHITRLQQYVFLLRVALARLLAVLRSSGSLPHTSDDPNLSTYDSNEGHRVPTDGSRLQPPMLSADNRSKSFGGTSQLDQQSQPQSSYEETVGEMKRLRSARMEKSLSTSFRKARASRIIDGPEAQDLADSSDNREKRTSSFRIIEDRDLNGEPRSELAFGNQDALTLDDIPRIVAAEQVKEQRPNAYRHAQNKLIAGSRGPKLLSGHQHDIQEPPGSVPQQAVERTKRYFSELSGLEYFIVRHVAVLQMQPLLEGHFNLEDLLSLIETRKSTFWTKLFKQNNKNEKPKSSKKKGVFGVPLEALVDRDGVESTHGVGPGALRVPALLDDAVTAMRQMDMSVEGVFRKNGNIRALKDLADRIDSKEGEVDLGKENAVQLAALLKKFLREMPDPLLTYKLHNLFTVSQKIGDESKRSRILHLTCCLLPKAHRDSLEILFSFLNWAASFSQVDEDTGSKMDSHNLATVIAPNILYANSKEGVMDESFLAIEAVHMLLDYHDQMCQVPEDIQSVLSDTDLFNNMPEITTKEILKRYGDMGRTPDHRMAPNATAVSATTSTAGATAQPQSGFANRPVDAADSPPIRTPNAPGPGGSGRPIGGQPFGQSGHEGGSGHNSAAGRHDYHGVDNGNGNGSGNGNVSGNGYGPPGAVTVASRIETDPTAQQAWQKESSVRHVQPANGYVSAHASPSQRHGEMGNSNGPGIPGAGNINGPIPGYGNGQGYDGLGLSGLDTNIPRAGAQHQRTGSAASMGSQGAATPRRGTAYAGRSFGDGTPV